MLRETKINYRALLEPYLSGEATTCSYCDFLSQLVLLKGKHTYITLAIGQFIEGYLQVCSIKHKTSAAGLNEEETEEIIKMKNTIRKTYMDVYGLSGIAFEHGEAGSCMWYENYNKNINSLCHHCHIHFVPVTIDIRDGIKEYLTEEIIIKNDSVLKTVRKFRLNSGPYLFFEDINGISYLYPVKDNDIIPRQFLRTLVADKLGIAHKGDWSKYPGIEFFDISKKKLVCKLEENYKIF